MPVTINEPLSVLQRLCEELEYCEILQKASTTTDPCQRMLLIAAFAISAYSSSGHRAGHKPFNPLLAETFECVREDMGFKFIAEQVSHHPPISACHAESKNYVFWQGKLGRSFWFNHSFLFPLRFASENEILGQINGNHSIWQRQCCPQAMQRTLQVEQDHHLRAQSVQGRALRGQLR